MLDRPNPASLFADLRNELLNHPAKLQQLLQIGDRLSELASGLDVTTKSPGDGPVLTTQRIAIIGSVTTDYIRRAVACAVATEGVCPIIYQAPYGSLVQEIIDRTSGLHRFGPDLVVIAPSPRDMLASVPINASEQDVATALQPALALYQRLWSTLAELNVKIMQHTLVAPSARYRGMAERLAPAAPANQVRWLNQALLIAAQGLVHFVDVEQIATEIGTRRWSAQRFYFAAKLDADPRYLPDYTSVFRAAWRAANARAKKVLVLDLDNTLWGGVIGDDGVDGLALGPASPEGEAFAAWQHYIKALAQRGVVLAVASKNSPETALTGFSHGNSVLQRSDFAAFECSWADKVGAIRRIARDLNLGLDSFVFADDNPAECALVQQELPEVAVVHLGSDPAQFVDIFDAGCWFDLPSYTEEDLGRAAAYTARAAALAEAAEATDIDGYLAGLAMKGSLYRPPEADIARVAQLEQKTNQFNTTTRRYSESMVRSFLDRDDAVVLAFRLSDRFGDHGLVSALIAFVEGDTLRIDSWLMSCRVFSRSAEPFILLGLIEIARQRGVTRVIAEYLPTAKNDVVADLYPKLGFSRIDEGLFARDLSQPVADLVTHVAPG